MSDTLDSYLPAWNRVANRDHLPEITTTTVEGKPRSATLLLRDAARRVRLGYFDGSRWQVLGPCGEDWTGRATHWQWFVDD